MVTSSALFVVLTFGGIHCAKILIIPGPATSHCLEKMSIADELLKRGHHVTLFSMVYEPKHCLSIINTDLYKSTFKVVEPNIDSSLKKSRADFIDMIGKHFFERRSTLMFMLKHMSAHIQTDCDIALKDTSLLMKLREEKYDLALVEGAPFTLCFFAIPLFLGIPTAAVGTYIDPEDCRMPFQTNTLPSMLTEYSNDMTFSQRLVNTLLSLIQPIIVYLLAPSIDLSQYSQELAEYKMGDLIKNSVLFIENSDYIVDYPKALFPNFVQVGGLTARPANPLPSELKKLLDQAKEGTVLVTFGSMLRSMTPELKEKLMSAFARLRHQVIFKQDKDEVRGNVKVMKWVPQNDILGHPNTKLFISHCGKNGFWEGVYHGVPIICMAIHAETYTTKVKVRKYGIGSSIEIFDDSVDDLVKTINGVLGNDTIYRNSKRIKTLLRDRLETPRQRAASAIEHVIKYGGDHMRPPSVEFGFFSYAMVDVWVTLFAFSLLIASFDIWLIRKCCCRRKVDKKKTE